MLLSSGCFFGNIINTNKLDATTILNLRNINFLTISTSIARQSLFYLKKFKTCLSNIVYLEQLELEHG